MNYTLQIIINPGKHILSGTKKNNRRVAVGDLIGVNITSDVAVNVGSKYILNDIIGSKRSAFIHVVGVPNIILLETIKKLIGPETSGSINPNRPTMAAKYKTQIKISSLPRLKRDELIKDKQITVNFSQIKNMLLNKFSGKIF